MTASNTELQEQAAATAVAEEPKARKKAGAAPRKPHSTSSKGKSSKKATPAKKAPKAVKGAKPEKKTSGARAGSKTTQVVDLMKRPSGATLKEIMAATNWQAHSVRGFISGTLGKKMGLNVTSAKREDGERVYSLAN
jgi:hypothetical protein